MVMDYKEKNEKYKDIISNLNEDLEELVSRTRSDIKDYVDENNPILSHTMPSCGSMMNNEDIVDEDLTAEEIEALTTTAEDEISDIIDELTSQEIISPEIEGLIERSDPGDQGGDTEGYVFLPKYSYPEWFDEIEAAVGQMIGQPDKGRTGTDYEEMQTYIEQGVMIIRRPKRMMVQESKEVYILLDQSGSMEWNNYNGVNFLKLLGAFIPLLGEEYDGYYWGGDHMSMDVYESDMKIPNIQIDLQDVSEKLLIRGGGGTSFDGAFRKLGDIERGKKEENPDYEMCVIFFSDMEIHPQEYLNYKKYGPSKILFVTAETHLEELQIPETKWIYDSDKHKIILINMENTKTN